MGYVRNRRTNIRINYRCAIVILSEEVMKVERVKEVPILVAVNKSELEGAITADKVCDPLEYRNLPYSCRCEWHWTTGITRQIWQCCQYPPLRD